MTTIPPLKIPLPVTEADIPEVPSFGDFQESASENAAQIGEQKHWEGTEIARPETPKDPLVVAAEDYARACRIHMDAQSQVAKAKQTLEGAKKQEEDTYKQRVEAQSRLAEMVAKTTEAVL